MADKNRVKQNTGGVRTDPRADEVKPSTQVAPEERDTNDELYATVDGVSDPHQTPQGGANLTIHGDIHATEEVHGHVDDFHEEMHPEFVDGFEEPRNLKAPEVREGFHQSWIRTDELPDFEYNGYTRRLASTIKKTDRAFRASRNESSEFIETAGMVLVEIPLERHARLVKATVEAKHKRNERATSEMLMDISNAGQGSGMAPIEAGMKQTVSR